MVSGSRGLLGHQALKCHACAEGLRASQASSAFWPEKLSINSGSINSEGGDEGGGVGGGLSGPAPTAAPAAPAAPPPPPAAKGFCSRRPSAAPAGAAPPAATPSAAGGQRSLQPPRIGCAAPARAAAARTAATATARAAAARCGPRPLQPRRPVAARCGPRAAGCCGSHGRLRAARGRPYAARGRGGRRLSLGAPRALQILLCHQGP